MTTTLSKKMTKLGREGGLATKRKKGKKFFSKISKLRKHCRGGRKPKDSNTNAGTTEPNTTTADNS